MSIGLPFDPAAEWGPRITYHLTGRVGGRRIRGAASCTDTRARRVAQTAAALRERRREHS